MDLQKYVVIVELREPHPVAQRVSRRAEEEFDTKADALTTYETLLSALRTLEAFSE